jgi:hypothetical protein
MAYHSEKEWVVLLGNELVHYLADYLGVFEVEATVEKSTAKKV